MHCRYLVYFFILNCVLACRPRTNSASEVQTDKDIADALLLAEKVFFSDQPPSNVMDFVFGDFSSDDGFSSKTNDIIALLLMRKPELARQFATYRERHERLLNEWAITVRDEMRKEYGVDLDPSEELKKSFDEMLAKNLPNEIKISQNEAIDKAKKRLRRLFPDFDMVLAEPAHAEYLRYSALLQSYTEFFKVDGSNAINSNQKLRNEYAKWKAASISLIEQRQNLIKKYLWKLLIEAPDDPTFKIVVFGKALRGLSEQDLQWFEKTLARSFAIKYSVGSNVFNEVSASKFSSFTLLLDIVEDLQLINPKQIQISSFEWLKRVYVAIDCDAFNYYIVNGEDEDETNLTSTLNEVSKYLESRAGTMYSSGAFNPSPFRDHDFTQTMRWARFENSMHGWVETQKKAKAAGVAPADVEIFENLRLPSSKSKLVKKKRLPATIGSAGIYDFRQQDYLTTYFEFENTVNNIGGAFFTWPALTDDLPLGMTPVSPTNSGLQVALSSRELVNSVDNFVPVIGWPFHDLQELSLKTEQGRLLQLGEDYQLFKLNAQTGFVAQLKHHITESKFSYRVVFARKKTAPRFSAAYKKAMNLPLQKLDEYIEILGQAKMTALKDFLALQRESYAASGKPGLFNLLGLATAIADNSYYVKKPQSTQPLPDAHGPLAKYSGFTRDGQPCGQCSFGNQFYPDSVNLLRVDKKLEARPIQGFLLTKSDYIRGPMHLETGLFYQNHLMELADATPLNQMKESQTSNQGEKERDRNKKIDLISPRDIPSEQQLIVKQNDLDKAFQELEKTKSDLFKSGSPLLAGLNDQTDPAARALNLYSQALDYQKHSESSYSSLKILRDASWRLFIEFQDHTNDPKVFARLPSRYQNAASNTILIRFMEKINDVASEMVNLREEREKSSDTHSDRSLPCEILYNATHRQMGSE